MSLMGTLAKVAIGVAVAKGASSLMSKSGGASGGGLQDMLGGVLGGDGQTGAQPGGLGGLLEGLQQENPNTQSGGLNDLLGNLGGQGGGLGALMQNLGGGSSGGGLGALGGMLGGLGGAAAASGGFGDLLNQAMQNGGEPEAQPTPEQDAVAGLMLRALIQAAKSDGQIDAAEQQKLMDVLGDVSDEEREFVQTEMQKPVDVQALAADVPAGLERQVYAMSLAGIDLDSQAEAQYLHQLAGALGMDPATVNTVHTEAGAPVLYS